MPGAARQVICLVSESLDSPRQHSGKKGRAGHGAIVLEHAPAQSNPARGANRLRLRAQPAHRLLARDIFQVPDIEAEGDVTGNDVARARLRRDLADSGKQPGAVPGQGLHGQDELCGRAKRVPAQVHGQGSGVSSLAGKGCGDAALAGNR